MGEEDFTYALELFDSEDVLLPLRKVQAIVTFLKDYPEERRIAACERARFFGVTGVRAFKDTLLPKPWAIAPACPDTRSRTRPPTTCSANCVLPGQTEALTEPCCATPSQTCSS
jgi:hypothetical protein